MSAEQLELFVCARCGEPGPALCGLCAWRADDERAYDRIKADLAEDAQAAAEREPLWHEPPVTGGTA